MKDEDGNVMNFATHTVEQTRNAPILKDIRKALLAGQKHPECIRCWEEEKAGIESSRQRETKQWGDLCEIVSTTQADGSIPYNTAVIDFDMRFGNLCNLKCVTCGPTESSMWVEDHEKLWGHKFDDSKYNWPLNETFWQNFESQIPNLRRIYIIGGEPMLIKAHLRFLEKCVEMDCAKNITIEYSTNITNIHKKYFNIWKHFNKIYMSCSIDGFGKINDYIRFPSKWDHIFKNLKLLDDLSPPNVELIITTTVNIFNIYYLDEMIRWKIDQNFANFNKIDFQYPIFSSHPLHVPKYLSIKVLPQHAKDVIRSKLRSVYNYTDNDILNNAIKTKVDGYINLMDSEDWSDLLPTFWNVTNKLDDIRGIKMSDHVPELYHLLKGE